MANLAMLNVLGHNAHRALIVTPSIPWISDRITVVQSVSRDIFLLQKEVDPLFGLGSTVGAQWRPAAPFYPYYPPMPYNWPYIIQATAHWGAQTSPAAGWLGQFGPAPGGPLGPVGGAYVAPAVPDVGPYPGVGGPYAGVGGPVGPFEKVSLIVIKFRTDISKMRLFRLARRTQKEKRKRSLLLLQLPKKRNPIRLNQRIP